MDTIKGCGLLFFAIIFLSHAIGSAAIPYRTSRGTPHGTQGYWRSHQWDNGRGSYARYYGRDLRKYPVNYQMNENNPWFRNTRYYGVGFPTAYDYNWYGFGGIDYQNYWVSYPSTFSNWEYPSYPYVGRYYRSSNPIFR